MNATIVTLRSSAPDVRNPLRKLGAAASLGDLCFEDRRQLRAHLDAIRRVSKAVSDDLHRCGRIRQAAYWRACSVYAGHAARLAHPRPSTVAPLALPQVKRSLNPLLALPEAQRVGDLSPAAGAGLARLLAELRVDARISSRKSWQTAKSPMAAYWSDVATFAGHCARFVRRRTRPAVLEAMAA
ncbi:MAG: hypothetical protein E6Q67_00810 [Roseateles sp.]|nr:MAG: hypothetical protein E6Q67_00810 [Roseateles sp.]